MVPIGEKSKCALLTQNDVACCCFVMGGIC